jgi:hypothetical protein
VQGQYISYNLKIMFWNLNYTLVLMTTTGPLTQQIKNLAEWFSWIVYTLAAIFVVKGAVSIAFSKGDPEAVYRGKKEILIAIIGGVLARALEKIVDHFKNFKNKIQ